MPYAEIIDCVFAAPIFQAGEERTGASGGTSFSRRQRLPQQNVAAHAN